MCRRSGKFGSGYIPGWLIVSDIRKVCFDIGFNFTKIRPSNFTDYSYDQTGDIKHIIATC
jgi:hypothetical protein